MTLTNNRHYYKTDKQNIIEYEGFVKAHDEVKKYILNLDVHKLIFSSGLRKSCH